MFSWPLLLRPHHIRALVILVTLLSLSLLFSTFSIRAGDNRIWMTDPSRQNAAGREVMSAMDVHHPESSSIFTLTTGLPTSTGKPGIGEVYQVVRKSNKFAIVKVYSFNSFKIVKVDFKFRFKNLPACSEESNEISGNHSTSSFGTFENQTFVPEPLCDARRCQVNWLLLRLGYYNLSFVLQFLSNTLAILNKKLEESKQQLNAEVGPDAGYWNVTHPRRLLIVTSWRSGSTFLGQILSEHPGVYNHYEPLMHVGVEQIRPGDPRVDSAIQHLRDLLRCR